MDLICYFIIVNLDFVFPELEEAGHNCGIKSGTMLRSIARKKHGELVQLGKARLVRRSMDQLSVDEWENRCAAYLEEQSFHEMHRALPAVKQSRYARKHGTNGQPIPVSRELMECLLSEVLRNSGRGRCRWQDQSNLVLQCRERLGAEEGGSGYKEAKRYVDVYHLTSVDSLFASETRANHATFEDAADEINRGYGVNPGRARTQDRRAHVAPDVNQGTTNHQKHRNHGTRHHQYGGASTYHQRSNRQADSRSNNWNWWHKGDSKQDWDTKSYQSAYSYRSAESYRTARSTCTEGARVVGDYVETADQKRERERRLRKRAERLEMEKEVAKAKERSMDDLQEQKDLTEAMERSVDAMKATADSGSQMNGQPKSSGSGQPTPL